MRRDRLRWMASRPHRRLGVYWRSCAARLRGERVVHMLHIGKTGGSSVKTAIRRNSDRIPVTVLKHHHDISLRDIPPWDDVFFFLRDPIARYVSGFNDRLRQGQPRFEVPWSPAEQRAFQHFHTADELACALSSDDAVIRDEAVRAMRSMRHINVAYSRWLGDERRLRARARHIILVGRQEQLQEDFERLKLLLGAPKRVRLPQSTRKANRAPGEAQPLSDLATANLRNWYARDIELLRFAEALDGRGDDA